MGPGARRGMTAGAALCFLHLFSGSRDRLGEALTNEAKAAGFDLIVEAYDICKGDDLTNPDKPLRLPVRLLADGWVRVDAVKLKSAYSIPSRFSHLTISGK